METQTHYYREISSRRGKAHTLSIYTALPNYPFKWTFSRRLLSRDTEIARKLLQYIAWKLVDLMIQQLASAQLICSKHVANACVT